MATGLEPSLCVRFYSQVRYPYNEFVHSIPSYFSKCIITTIRLSGLSWRTKTTFAPLASRLITLVLQYTCNTETLCVIQPTFLKLCKYYRHDYSAWAWDHDCHITPMIYYVSVGAPSSWFIYRMR